MANNIWDEFDNQVDTKALAEDVKNNTGTVSYREVEEGVYEVELNKLELVASKSGKPMVKAWFKIVSEGSFNGSYMFMNQVIDEAFKIHRVNELLRSFDSGLDIEFVNYKQYGNLLMDVHEKIDEMHLTYQMNYHKNNRGYDLYEVEEVFEPED